MQKIVKLGKLDIIYNIFVIYKNDHCLWEWLDAPFVESTSSICSQGLPRFMHVTSSEQSRLSCLLDTQGKDQTFWHNGCVLLCGTGSRCSASAAGYPWNAPIFLNRKCNNWHSPSNTKVMICTYCWYTWHAKDIPQTLSRGKQGNCKSSKYFVFGPGTFWLHYEIPIWNFTIWAQVTYQQGK